MNLAGIGVSIMVDKTAFKKLTEDMQIGFDGIAAKLRKLTYGDLVAARDILADVHRLRKIAERRRSALSAFVSGRDLLPPDASRRFALFDKAADTLNRGDAIEAGLILPLESAQRPEIDPSASVANTMLSHTKYQRD